MKIKELLNKEIEPKTIFEVFEVFLGGPLRAIYNTFNRKVVKESTNTNIVYDVRQSQPIVIRSEKYMSDYFSKSNLSSGIAIDSVKYGMKREICDEIMRSDLFEWAIDETVTGTRIAARLIVNKFQK
jgi:hypothetical protein